MLVEIKSEGKMKDKTLQKLYPDLWESVRDSVIADMAMYSKTVAHNAAFYACDAFHKSYSKKSGTNEPK